MFACTIQGTAHADTLVGTSGRDVICGFAGADRIRGLGGDDIVFGGRGADTIDGGAGSDSLHGNAGADAFSVKDGEVDVIVGGKGHDTARIDMGGRSFEVGRENFLGTRGNWDGKIWAQIFLVRNHKRFRTPSFGLGAHGHALGDSATWARGGAPLGFLGAGSR